MADLPISVKSFVTLTIVTTGYIGTCCVEMTVVIAIITFIDICERNLQSLLLSRKKKLT